MADGAIHARNTDGIKPFLWEKGKSGNPSGRPKNSVSITTAIRRLLAQPGKQDEAAEIIWREFRNGNPAIVKEVWARMDGQLTQPLDIRVNGVEVDAINPEALPQVATELGITQGEIDAANDGLAVAMLGTGGDDPDSE